MLIARIAARSGRPVLPLLGLGLLLLLSGCAASSPSQNAAFLAFAESIRDLRGGVDSVLAIQEDWARQRFLSEAAAAGSNPEGIEALETLLLNVKVDNPLEIDTTDAPGFIEAERFRDGFYRLNSSCLAYADLLAELAGPDVLSTESFDRLAEGINKTLSTAETTLTSRPGRGRNRSLISAAFSEAVRGALESKRHRQLKRAIQANQPAVESFTELARDGVRIIARFLNHEYQEHAVALGRALASPGEADPASRRETVEAFVSLDRQFMDQLAILNGLDTAYEALATAHGDLALAASTPRNPSTALRMLSDEVKRVRTLGQSLSQPTNSTPSEAPGE